MFSTVSLGAVYALEDYQQPVSPIERTCQVICLQFEFSKLTRCGRVLALNIL